MSTLSNFETGSSLENASPTPLKRHAFSENFQKESAPEAAYEANIVSEKVRAAKLLASPSGNKRILMGTDNAALNRYHTRS